MTTLPRRWPLAIASAIALLAISTTETPALQVRPKSERFEDRIVDDPTRGLDVASTPLPTLPSGDAVRRGWESFRATKGPAWSITLDRRSGAPLLAEGKLAWPSATNASVETLAASLREFAASHRALLLADDAELVLNTDASGELIDGVWQIVFDRQIAGVPVAGERYLFTVGHGSLIAFGTPRWSRIDASPFPELDEVEAQVRLAAHMGLTPADAVQLLAKPTLTLIPLRAGAKALTAGPYEGVTGEGYTSALVWRITLRVPGEPGTWVGLVDAHTGAIRSLVDDARYARVKGGVYPVSDDQICPDGCEQPGLPMPFANITIGSTTSNANTFGTFNCTPGGSSATTTLTGQYVAVNDQCGPVSQSVTCSADLDLNVSPGTDCDVPPGGSPGNTHAARSSYYHLNRIAEHARTWLPTRTWLNGRLTDTVNINRACNAYWDGSGVNFFKSGGSCRNTGEIAGVFLHEWGHGLDQNDGGGFDNPSEAYADITAFMSTHVSCVGRGFLTFNCGGYGDACLNCTGVRDQDWDQHAFHTPATPAGFAANQCAQGGGPCGLEEHCEGYVSAETIWDLANRDLPASGLDAASSWLLTDRLWYKSRLGSGGDAYNCALPASDGCSATSWYEKIRVIDDDDGDLSNGTPHAAAIFAAFDRHAIACGSASDPANQNSAGCPVLGVPSLLATAGSTNAALSWTPVANSIGTRIFRNDLGCDAATNRVALTSTGSYSDTGLVNGLTVYYSVQGVAANGACDGPVSNCVALTPQSAAGTIKLDAGTYACGGTANVTVTDSNIGTNTTTVAFTSSVETSPAETVTLTRVAPGSATYAGSIALTAGPPVHDGVLSIANGGTIQARYVDANDGAGHSNQQRVTTAASTCTIVAGPKPVPDGSFGTPMTCSRGDVAGGTIALVWDVATCSSPDNHLLYGSLAAVSSMTVTGAVCDLGTSGTATWSNVPADDLWYVIVGDDNAATEGSWGTDGLGAQRGGSTPSGFCGVSARDNSGVCP